MWHAVSSRISLVIPNGSSGQTDPIFFWSGAQNHFKINITVFFYVDVFLGSSFDRRSFRLWAFGVLKSVVFHNLYMFRVPPVYNSSVDLQRVSDRFGIGCCFGIGANFEPTWHPNRFKIGVWWVLGLFLFNGPMFNRCWRCISEIIVSWWALKNSFGFQSVGWSTQDFFMLF